MTTQSDNSQVVICENCGKHGPPTELHRFEWEAARKKVQEYGNPYSTTKAISWFPVVPRVVIAVTLCKECIQKEADRLSIRGLKLPFAVIGVLGILTLLLTLPPQPLAQRILIAAVGVLALSTIPLLWLLQQRVLKKAPEKRSGLRKNAQFFLGVILEPYCRRKLVEGGYDLAAAVGAPGHTHVTRNPNDEAPQSAVSPFA